MLTFTIPVRQGYEFINIDVGLYVIASKDVVESEGGIFEVLVERLRMQVRVEKRRTDDER